ncbi:hypothetical protein CHS0354_040560 [Potamilus streckersoni]|uniref:Cytochrome P450 n=1 Tax=Potamilus streckersoni TaxID=2493646 RepID=A0AAE0SGL3_9BIVA|nr:hypothetical protein CHS0354_040560 [Potamilus streckersoni]
MEIAVTCIPILPVVIIIARWMLKKRYSNLPPGPAFSLFSTLSVVLQELHPSQVHLTLEKWAKEHGPLLHFQVLSKHFIVLSSAKLARKALASEEYMDFTNSRKTCFRGIHFMWNHDVILQGKYGEGYIKLRKYLSRGLTAYGHGVPVYEKDAESNVRWLVQKIKDTKRKDFDPKPIIKEAIANFISILLTGDFSVEKSEQIQDFLDTVLETVEPSFEACMDTFPFLRFIPGTRFNKLCKKFQKIKDKVLSTFYDKTKSSFHSEKTRGLVDALLRLQIEDSSGGESKLSDNQAKGIILDAISGALLTSTYGCLAAIACIMNHEKCLATMRKEIDENIGSSRLPCSVDLAKLHYTHAVILETLRYSSHIATQPMKCTTKDIEFEGYTIPAETGILVNVWSAHHDPDVWIDPWMFQPERFLDTNGHILPPTHELRQLILSFGIGPRYCLGKSLGESWIFLTLATLIQQFDLLPPSNGTLVSDDPHNYEGKGIIGPAKFMIKAKFRGSFLS